MANRMFNIGDIVRYVFADEDRLDMDTCGTVVGYEGEDVLVVFMWQHMYQGKIIVSGHRLAYPEFKLRRVSKMNVKEHMWGVTDELCDGDTDSN